MLVDYLDPDIFHLSQIGISLHPHWPVTSSLQSSGGKELIIYRELFHRPEEDFLINEADKGKINKLFLQISEFIRPAAALREREAGAEHRHQHVEQTGQSGVQSLRMKVN